MSNIGIIEGKTGIIFIDAGMSPVRMEALRLKFRKITDKPMVTTTGRNYMNSYAIQLRTPIKN